MTERKFDKYTLWLKWRNLGWKPAITCLNLPWPSENPREILGDWFDGKYASSPYWNNRWMILGGDKKPAELSKQESATPKLNP